MYMRMQVAPLQDSVCKVQDSSQSSEGIQTTTIPDTGPRSSSLRALKDADHELRIFHPTFDQQHMNLLYRIMLFIAFHTLSGTRARISVLEMRVESIMANSKR